MTRYESETRNNSTYFQGSTERDCLGYKHVKKKNAFFTAEHGIKIPTDKDRSLICASLVLSTRRNRCR